MKITKNDFVRWSQDMANDFHDWEVLIPFGPVGHLRFRQEKFVPEEYETPEDEYEAVCDLVRGCRMTDTEYSVFCDGRLVLNF